MSVPTTEYLDQRFERLETTTQTILTEMRKGFTDHDARLGEIGTRLAGIDSRLTDHDARFVDILSRLTDHDARFQRIENTLATLVESVDRFAKIYTDLNQEVVVMRQQLRDVEDRVQKLELKLKTA